MNAAAYIFAAAFILTLALLVIACGTNQNLSTENRRLRAGRLLPGETPLADVAARVVGRAAS